MKDCRPICADKASGRGPFQRGRRALAGHPGHGPAQAAAGGGHGRRAASAPVAALLALLTALCAGCGQKGDLYLPDESPEAQARR